MAKWNINRLKDLEWCRPISARAQKEKVAAQLASRLHDGDVVGIGSGSTSFLTLLALASRAKDEGLAFTAIVTSIEMARACSALGVRTEQLGEARPDWSFDGADEISPEGRLIKGRGGAVFKEKLVMAASCERYIVVDESKFVAKLGDRFPVPLEVIPLAIELVVERLRDFGLSSWLLRIAQNKDGPVITEFAGVILDVRFSETIPKEQDLEALPGVIAAGVFDDWKYKVVSFA